MNKVYRDEKSKNPMTAQELADAANAICSIPVFEEWDFSPMNQRSRIAGTGHCGCFGNGEFVLLPLDHPAVQEGEKRYMQCRKCGGYSHL